MKKLYIILMALAAFVYTNGQTTITIYPDKDAELFYGEASQYSHTPTTNYGESILSTAMEWTSSGLPWRKKGLIGIDLSGLPSYAIITEAKLYLYGTGSHRNDITMGSSSYKSNASYLRRVTTAWDEHTVTWNTAPTTTTSNQVTLSNSTIIDQDYVVDVTALIRDMHADPDNSDGIMMNLVTPTYYTEMRFASSDYSDASMHPKLELTYTTPILPDIESFEYSSTKWDNVDGDNTEWVRDASGTPSSSTGPTKANHGKYYAYIEASSPNYPSKNAYLESPTYFMDDYENVTIQFDYHMYGSTMGSLTLQILDENDEIWDEIWFLSGNQGNVWKSALIEISSLPLNETFQFRFIGRTGTSYTGDMALDHIEVRATKKVSPTGEQNYIHTVSPITDNGLDGMSQQSLQYFDGLGRLSQEIEVGSSPEGRDMVVLVEYDAAGRQDKNYLPFPEGMYTGGSYRTTAIADQESFYQNHFDLGTESPFAYARTVFEESALNRVLEQGAPGRDFSPIEETGDPSEHVREINYASNATVDVRYFSVDANGDLVNNPTYYTENTLYKNIVYDEDGNKTEEFKNFLGQIVLKNSVEGSIDRSTYYVYDDFGLLRFVIPPKAMGENGIPDSFKLYHLCYQYKYDERKRMIEKKLPGVEPVFLVYDNRDRLVATQDGNMRVSDHWLYTKYDALNRPVITGMMDTYAVLSQAQVQADIDAFYSITSNKMYEERIASANGYTNQSYPSTGSPISFTYYDNYDHLNLSWYTGSDFDAINNIDTYQADIITTDDYNQSVKGQVTGTAILVLDDIYASWVFNSHFYDNKYRVIQTQSTLYPSGTSMSSTKYDFVGTVLENLEMQAVNSTTNKVHYFYTYDHALRPRETSVMINGDDAVLLSQNSYNELGELIEKNLHSTDNLTYAQSVDYSYNIRGWLTCINDPEDFISEPDDLFAMKLWYNEDAGISNTPLYNGNISALTWARTASNIEGYKYEYDELSRLTDADYHKMVSSTWSNVADYDSEYTYDLNGNISSLARKEANGTLADNLIYDYTGSNQLLHVADDNTPDALALYLDQSTQGFTYDANGNMTLHEDKQLTVEYNHLNLPEKVQTQNASGDKIEYIYDAAGMKWLKKVDNGALENIAYCGSFVYKDVNGTGSYSLDYLLSPEGRIEVDGAGTLNYRYALKDHLGSTRVEFDAAMTNNQETDYYSFGMAFTNSTGGDNKYLYNGKELQDEQLGGVNLDWYDYGARFYDPALGRWHVIDPKSEEAQHWSPYTYVENNPLAKIDPNGEKGVTVIFGQVSASAGVVVGGVLSIQQGKAWDEAGHTQFTGSAKMFGIGHPGVGKPEGAIGVDFEIGDAGLYRNKDAQTFGKAFETGVTSFHMGAVDFGVNEGGWLLSAGLSFGAGIDRVEIDNLTSISVSKKEDRKLSAGTWSVENSQLSEDGKSYVGNVSVTSRKYYSNGSWSSSSAPVTTRTNIQVTSGVKYDKDGNPYAAGDWKSDKYRDNENKL